MMKYNVKVEVNVLKIIMILVHINVIVSGIKQVIHAIGMKENCKS